MWNAFIGGKGAGKVVKFICLDDSGEIKALQLGHSVRHGSQTSLHSNAMEATPHREIICRTWICHIDQPWEVNFWDGVPMSQPASGGICSSVRHSRLEHCKEATVHEHLSSRNLDSQVFALGVKLEQSS